MKKAITFILILFACIVTAQEKNSQKDSADIDGTPQKSGEAFVLVDRMPEYPGGTPALFKDIADSIIYPASAIEAGITGKCFLRFVVGADGYIGPVEVQRGVPGCPECDAEAVRVMKTLKRFTPGYNKGVAVPVWFQIPLSFTLTDSSKKKKK